MAEAAVTISAIVVSFNTRQMTLECLQTLQAELAGKRAEIIVVDNASTDGSAAAIEKTFPGATVIANGANRGFGPANNQAMRVAGGEYFLLLNSDAFPKAGAVEAMLKYMGEHPEAGVIGPQLLNADGTVQRSCFRFPSPGRAWLENLWISRLVPNTWAWGDWRRWEHDQEREVDFVTGACMLIRRRVFEETGGFDERFFMYAEETDWQKRIAETGWRVRFTPTAAVTHLGGASGEGKMNGAFFEGLDYYELKHHGLVGLIVLRMAMVFGCAVRAAGWAAASLIPGRRDAAMRKLKLRLWLIQRQLTDWSSLARWAARGKTQNMMGAAKGMQ